MPASDSSSSSVSLSSRSPRAWTIASSLLLIALGGWAYRTSFSGAFVLDDISDIVKSPAVTSVGPLWRALLGTTRPLTQLSFAINYRLGGLDPRGYHAVNLIIHIAAAILLAALIRRRTIPPHSV